MGPREELISLLTQQFDHPHGWADEDVDAGSKLVSRLTAEDWHRLATEWRDKSQRWQRGLIGCIYTVAGNAIEPACSLITDMIKYSDEKVASFAVEALQAIPNEFLRKCPVDHVLLARLQSIAAISVPVRLEVEALLARLGVPRAH